ncbi:MAG: diphosphate--fructose-6-phosphate 1-phosphotransferase [Victivallales bacterium]|nr:diphosphate--fructose-6-phosphate 1-phosphotransferase [Victivallales bacterium]
MTTISALQKARFAYSPKLPPVLAKCGPFAAAVEGKATESVADQAKIQKLFPDTYGLPAIEFKNGKKFATKPISVGVILSGGQAPGGHNVIAGLFDGLKALNAKNRLFGFQGGPSGLIDDKYIMLDKKVIDTYRNTGGFDMICSGRTKLETEEQFEKVAANCKAHGISAIVIIGGDDSNTNACALAQYMLTTKTGVKVIGCPKTIDGDLKNEWIEVSFGFDTATKVYSELIGNIMRDANSARKYWHFIKLMGRSASHIALECALQTHPTAALISEEVEARKTSLKQISDSLTKLVVARADKGMKFGVVLIPEGLVEFIPEMKALIAEINDVLAKNSAGFEKETTADGKAGFVAKLLTRKSAALLNSLPNSIRDQLLGDRDPHGNVQVSKIETEKLLIELISANIKAINAKRDAKKKVKFGTQAHFFGYEGRCAAPSNFDADYCYSLGFNAAALIGAGKTGYMSSVRNVSAPAAKWIAGGIPLTMMMNMEHRHGKDVPVIRKALVELKGKPFKTFEANREKWAEGVEFVYPGPIQYFGPAEVADRVTLTLALEHK